MTVLASSSEAVGRRESSSSEAVGRRESSSSEAVGRRESNAPYAERRRRLAEIDALRLERRLTDAELAEADRITDQIYMRLWHSAQREAERRSAAAENADTPQSRPPRRDAPAAEADPPPAAAGAFDRASRATRAALAAIAGKRVEHVTRGYTPAADQALPRAYLAAEAGKYQREALDLIQRGRPAAQVRLKLVNAAALLVAAIERLDAEQSPTKAEPRR